MSKADFLKGSLIYKEHEFNGKKCLIKEMDAQEYATVIDVIKMTFTDTIKNEMYLDVMFKAYVVSITLHDEEKNRIFDPFSEADLKAITACQRNQVDETYKKSMRLSGLHGFIGEEPPKKPEA